MKIKTIEMEVLLAIAKTKNLSYAATLLGMQQANVSKYLANFESRIGLKVFERSSREILITDFGRSLIPYIENNINSIKTTTDFISDYKCKGSGVVTIYAPMGIMAFLSKEIIPVIKETEEIIIALKIYNPDNEAFFSGMEFPEDCDILLTYTEPKDDSLVALKVASLSVQAYASPSYLDANPIFSPQDLYQHSCILIHSALTGMSNIWHFSNNKSTAEYKVSGNYICDNSMTAIELAKQGLGIFLTSPYIISEELKNGSLRPCFGHRDIVTRLDLKVIFKKREYQPYRVQYILDKIVYEIKKYTQNHGVI
ncbi:LysR substrate-binding domain-containing protein [Enterobacter mori]|uniref:LysR substrate-binding domain-containing protein n=1 Tax=Enterobacter mori TaxID=539813 RepID=UPI002236102E|nr:LysR substrate-binding domain-containing protein [Enterobacter mori]MCW4989837.1 LysR substrate-binding domain-containing protein [Enterobacter mori]